MLKIGVIGAGHLGKIHLRILSSSATYELIGFHDVDGGVRKKVAEEMNLVAYDSAEELIAAVDVVDIVTPTPSHFEYAKQAMKMGKHVFIEKPVTKTVSEAEQLLKLAAETGVKVQVGHVERFNPAYLSVKEHDLRPLFIEGHRLATFNPRGTDVSVVMDLMIHDIDLVLALTGAEILNISASGVGVISNTTDIANARIEFDNACVANLTASRLSMKNMRKIRIFQPHAYITMDFLEKKSQIFQLSDAPLNGTFAQEIHLGISEEKKYVCYEEPKVEAVNAIEMELHLLAEAIQTDGKVPVSLEDGYKALRVAHQIMEQIEERIVKVNI